MKTKEMKWWTARLIKFFLPFLIAGSVIMLLYLVLSLDVFKIIGGSMAAYFFPPAGKETVIPISVNALKFLMGYGPLAIPLAAAPIAFVDIIVGLFLLWNFDITLKIPLIGGYIKKIQEIGKKKLKKNVWTSRFAFLAITGFVIIPFQGTGAILATIIGLIVGMKKIRIWYAIIIGSLVGCFAWAGIGYYFGDAIKQAFNVSFVMGIGLVGLLVIAVAVIYLYVKKRM